MIHEQKSIDSVRYFATSHDGQLTHSGFTMIGTTTRSAQADFIDADSELDAMAQVHTNGVDATGYNPLPEVGEPVAIGTWSYGSELVICRQAHNRTIYPPNETPALFSTYRDETGSLEWIANEAVLVGTLRMYNGGQYKCIQAHQTQSDWTPNVTPTLWVVESAPPADEISEWVQPAGAHDAYQIQDKVTYNDLYWESNTANNVWAPSVYGWDIIEGEI